MGPGHAAAWRPAAGNCAPPPRKSGAKARPSRWRSLAEFGGWVRERLFFLDYAPVIFTSAKTGFHLDRFLESIRYVAAQLQQKVPTAILNRTLHDAIERRQPVSSAGHRLKFYLRHPSPPVAADVPALCQPGGFVFRPYQKYLAQEMRRAFGYEGCPIVLVARTAKKPSSPSANTAPRKTGATISPENT